MAFQTQSSSYALSPDTFCEKRIRVRLVTRLIIIGVQQLCRSSRDVHIVEWWWWWRHDLLVQRGWVCMFTAIILTNCCWWCGLHQAGNTHTQYHDISIQSSQATLWKIYPSRLALLFLIAYIHRWLPGLSLSSPCKFWYRIYLTISQNSYFYVLCTLPFTITL